MDFAFGMDRNEMDAANAALRKWLEEMEAAWKLAAREDVWSLVVALKEIGPDVSKEPCCPSCGRLRYCDLDECGWYPRQEKNQWAKREIEDGIDWG
jgi:hypothetical protein